MSETAQRDRHPADAPAAKLGAELRERRQSLGWELPDLAGSLRIRQPYLEAIEAGRIGDLPGTTYALGFVRAYASALGLAGEQVASRFRAESAEASVRPTLSFPAPVPQRGVPAGALMLLGLLILAAAYSGWYYVSEHQRTPPETVPPIPDHLLPHTAAKPAPSPQVASILPGASAPAPVPPAPAAPAPAVSAHAPSAPDNSALAISTPPPAPAHTSPPPAPAQPANPAQTAAPLPLPATPQARAGQTGATSLAPPAQPPATAAPPGTRVLVKANADAWVTIRPGAGAPVFNKLMHAGDSWPVPAAATGLLLTTGNAGATEIDVDNVPAVSLGASGAVRRDLPLDPDMLKSGHLPPSGHARPKPAPAGAALN